MTNHTAQIIQLFAARPKAGKKFNLRVTVSADRPEPGTQRDVSGTAENFRLRHSRYYAWREAPAVMKYGAPEGDTHDFVTDEIHGMLVTKWCAAWACLMLTPAPNGRELNWKRDQ